MLMLFVLKERAQWIGASGLREKSAGLDFKTMRPAVVVLKYLPSVGDF